MQNAWRFVDDEVLRERLKEAKGIGTPATRAEIIGGLKKQGFLIAQGKHIVPTEAGLSLFGVLKQADPALVDPGVTAQLECLLDDVVVGSRRWSVRLTQYAASPSRIIGKLKEGAADGPPLLGATVGNGHGTFPPTPAMKRFADSLARQKGIKPPPGCKTSISICRKFLSEHAPKKAEGETLGKLDSKPVSPAQILYAKKIAQGKGVVIPEDAKANSAAMSAWIDSNRSAKRRKRGRKTAYKPAGSVAPRSIATTKRSRKRKVDAATAPLAPAQPNSVTGTPLRIPYGNKEVAQACVFGATAGFSEDTPPPRVRGTLDQVNGNMLTIKTRSATPTTVQLKDGAPVIATVEGSMSDIQDNSFVGITAMAQPDGTIKAVEVHVFAKPLRGRAKGITLGT
jgi:DNA topoisomerase-3